MRKMYTEADFANEREFKWYDWIHSDTRRKPNDAGPHFDPKITIWVKGWKSADIR